ncbi:MAG: tetratricopeptide repeat protein [Planctomycetota bacterium]
MMLKRFAPLALGAAVGLATILGTPAVSKACLWDYDTLAQERSRFPSVLELLSGKFLRHSAEFYQWRVKDRLAQLEGKSGKETLPLLDDLGVAYSKLDMHEQAIAMGEKALAIDPARYETHANLGTFLIHAGKLEEGLAHIKKAIEINPQAHFGRERWQQYIVEFVLQRAKLPADQATPSPLGKANFMHSLESDLVTYLRERVKTVENRDFDPAEALKGMLGIMRFGKHNHPIVLETVAQLLVAGKGPNSMDLKTDARLLAARCLLYAARMTTNEAAAKQYRKYADDVLSVHEHMKVSIVDEALTIELKEAELWFAQLRADEIGWIASGGDVDALYSAKYYVDPQANGVETGEANPSQGPGKSSPPTAQQLSDEEKHLAELTAELEQLRKDFRQAHPELGKAMEPAEGDDMPRRNDRKNQEDEKKRKQERHDDRHSESAEPDRDSMQSGQASSFAPGSVAVAPGSAATTTTTESAPVPAPRSRTSAGGCSAGSRSGGMSLLSMLALMMLGLVGLRRRG